MHRKSKATLLTGLVLSASAAVSLVTSVQADGAVAHAPKGVNIDLVVDDTPSYLLAIRQTLGKGFTERTGIKVNVVNTGVGNYQSVDQRVEADLAAGQPDDMAIIGLDSLNDYVAAGRAVPLNSFMKQPSFDASSYFPSFLKLGEVGEQTYGIPYAISENILYYNANEFVKAGLNPNDPPKTYSQLESDAQKIVSSKAAQWGVTWGYDHSANYEFQAFLDSAGGRMLNRTNTAVEFDSAQGISVLTYWQDLFKAGLGEPMTQAQSNQAFEAGQLAMVINSSSNTTIYEDSAKFSIRSAEMPVPDDGKLAAPPGGGDLVILTKNHRLQQAAWQVIEELTSPVGSTWASLDGGYSPVSKAAAESNAYLKRWLDSQPLLRPATAEENDAAPWVEFPGPNALQIDTDLNSQVFLAISDQETPAQALATAASQASSLLK